MKYKFPKLFLFGYRIIKMDAKLNWDVFVFVLWMKLCILLNLLWLADFRGVLSQQQTKFRHRTFNLNHPKSFKKCSVTYKNLHNFPVFQPGMFYRQNWNFSSGNYSKFAVECDWKSTISQNVRNWDFFEKKL